MHYYAMITRGDGSYVVSFPDLPNVNTYGSTLPETLAYAADALNACLEMDFERGFSLPRVTVFKGRRYHPILVQPHIEIAYTLRKLRNGRSQADIAKRLGISYQAYQKLENPRRCNPTVKTLEKIGEILGKRFHVRFA